MPRKNSSYFVPADRDCPCEGCDKVRATCRFCEKCNGCCTCCPTFICPFCLGYESGVDPNSDIAKEMGHACQCEPCAGGCGINIMDRDDGSYLPGRYEPYCPKCYAVVEPHCPECGSTDVLESGGQGKVIHTCQTCTDVFETPPYDLIRVHNPPRIGLDYLKRKR